MNEKQLKMSEILRNIDYLEIKFKGDVNSLKGDYKGSTNGYRFVLDREEYVLITGSYGIVGEGFNKIRLKNHILYSNDIIEKIKEILDNDFENVCNLQITRIDVANDIVNREMINEIKLKFIEKQIKSGKDFKIIGTGFDDIETFTCFKRNSPIYIRFYNKTRELNKSKKQYLLQLYAKYNMKNVWRLEFQINKTILIDEIEDIKKVVNNNYIKNYFKLDYFINNYEKLNIRNLEISDINPREIARAMTLIEKIYMEYKLDDLDNVNHSYLAGLYHKHLKSWNINK